MILQSVGKMGEGMTLNYCPPKTIVASRYFKVRLNNRLTSDCRFYKSFNDSMLRQQLQNLGGLASAW